MAADGFHRAGLQEGLADEGLEVIGAGLPGMGSNVVGIVVVAGAQLEGTAVIGLVPVGEGCVVVGVTEGGVSAEGETVRCKIAEQLQGIVVVKTMGHPHIGIGKIGSAARVRAVLGQELEDPVRIGDTAARNEGGLFADGPLDMAPAGENTDAQRTFHFVAVAFLGGNVEHGGDSSAVFGRDGALVQFHAFHQVRIEGREDAEQVAGVVDGVVVKEDEVLVGTAAAHVEAAGGLAHALDAG